MAARPGDLSLFVYHALHDVRDERPVEYIFAYSVLTSRVKPPAGVLDVGGCESFLAPQLALRGYRVTVLDLRPCFNEAFPVRMLVGNVLTVQLEPSSFDAVLAISTVEHVGLPAYGQDIVCRDADVIAAHRIAEWLKPGGLAIITVPYGKRVRPATFERVYNRERLWMLTRPFRECTVVYACGPSWARCDPRRAEREKAVAMLACVK